MSRTATIRALNASQILRSVLIGGGESEGNHILLAVAASVAEFLASLAKSFEEFRVIYQAATFYFSLARNTTSRLGFSIVSVLHLRSMPRLPRAKKAQ